jgi:hypothetical protein
MTMASAPHCPEHEAVVRLMEDTHANTVKIIQALHGELGSNDAGMVGRVDRIDRDVHELRGDLDDHIESHRDAVRTWSGRVWDFALKVIPWVLAAAGIGGLTLKELL